MPLSTSAHDAGEPTNGRAAKAAARKARSIAWTSDDVPAPAMRDIDPQRLRQWVRAYMHHAPLALVLRELNRLLAIEMLPPMTRGNVLDVGCGDGFWWTLRDRRDCNIFGVDIDASEVAQANAHMDARCADISRGSPFAEHRFDEIIGNCSLEHVRDLAGALRQLRRVARPGGRLVLFVPSQHWAMHGRLQRTLMARAPRLGMALAGALDGFFQHWHTYDVDTWRDLLHRSGWTLTRAHGLGNDRSEFLFRLFLPQAFAGFAVKQAAGVYPNRWLKALPQQLLNGPEALLTWALTCPLVDAEASSAYEYMLVARADADV